jgi:gas vesicle protein
VGASTLAVKEIACVGEPWPSERNGQANRQNFRHAAWPGNIKLNENFLFSRSVAMTGSKWTTFFAFFLGASLGVGIGMLLAPKSGEELREDLSDQLNEGTRRARAAGRAVSRRAQEMAETARQNVSEMADAGVRAARKVTRP